MSPKLKSLMDIIPTLLIMLRLNDEIVHGTELESFKSANQYTQSVWCIVKSFNK